MTVTFGRYQLLKRLAAGGMAEVYLARQSGLEGFEKLVVLKRILPHLAESDEFVNMFLQEARTAARLNHANIVQIFDVGREQDFYFIAMEYVHGEDVRRVVRQASAVHRLLPLPLAVRIAIGACEGLEYAHSKADNQGKPLNIVHRDISPQNILVTFDGGVKVIDFGIAKAADQVQQTRSGVLKGKYSYMSPEQANGKKVDRRSDVFAVAIVLYELVTGTRLFKRATDLSTLNAVMACKVEPPHARNPAIDEDLDAILLRALAKNRDQRTATCGQLQLELEAYLSKHQLPGSSGHLGQFMRDIYAERLGEEARVGTVVPPDSGLHGALPEGVASPPQGSPPPVSSGHTPVMARPATPVSTREMPRVVGAAPESDGPTIAKGGASASRWKRLALAAGLVVVFAGALVAWRASRADASVLVTSEPSGAEISLDGDVQFEHTPHTIVGLTRNQTYALTLTLPNYQPVARDLVVASGGKQKPVHVPLERLKATYLVTSDPPGAMVFLDAKPCGRTQAGAPLKAGPLLVGDEEEHHLVLMLDGYEDDDNRLKPRAAEQVEVNRKLTPKHGAAQAHEPPAAYGATSPASTPVSAADPTAPRPLTVPLPRTEDAPSPPPHHEASVQLGTLRVTSTPPGFVVQLDGTPIGSTPVNRQVPPGVHTVAFVDPERFLDDEQKVEVRPGEVATATRELEPRLVRFGLHGAATVYCNGHKLGEAPGQAALFPGAYDLDFVNGATNEKGKFHLVVNPGKGAQVAKLSFEH